MKRKLRAFSVNNTLSYYTDEKNIPNQELVGQTIQYFEKGDGKRAFEPLEFLNLLRRQLNFINENIKDTNLLLSTLDRIPLTELEQHILYGFIIKWFGGYPLEAPLKAFTNSDKHYEFRKKLLEKFLGYKGETPEKRFCKVDFERRKEHQKVAIALTTAINHGLNVTEVLNSLEEPSAKERIYNRFDELFADAIEDSAAGKFKTQKAYLIEKSKHNFQFDVWLQQTKGWEYGNKEQYTPFLNKKTFQEYLDFITNKMEHKNIGTITDLRINNRKFDELKNTLQSKIDVASFAIDSSEFLKSEIERVENEYMKPLEITVSGGKITSYFSFDKYRKIAFDCLTKGLNYPIQNIMDNAEREYKGGVLPEEFSKQIIYNLSDGVGYFLYKGYLKEELKKLQANNGHQREETNDKPETKNNFIERYLESLANAFNSQHEYKRAVDEIALFFNSKSSRITTPLFVKNGNIKRLAFALGEIWRSKSNDVITYEYLKFYKRTFSIFSNQDIEPSNLFGTNLYKYSISKT